MEREACKGHPVARLYRYRLQEACKGHPEAHVRVKGHALWQTGPFVWCRRCGHLGRQFVDGLGERCRGVVQAGGTASRLRNLAAGRSPYAKVSSAVIGRPTRLTLATWLQWRGIRRDLDDDPVAPEVADALRDDDVECDAD